MSQTAEQEIYHVIPADDWHEHAKNEMCECNPKLDIKEDGLQVMIHNSFDGREHLEANHDWRNCDICIADLETTEKGW